MVPSKTSTARVLFAVAALAAAFDGSPGRAAAAGQRPPAAATPAPRGADRHLPQDALEAELKALAAAHAASATLVEFGRTAGGRRLWAIEMAAPGTAPPASRPGILLVANLSADQVAGSTLALGIARALLTSTDEGVRRQLAAGVFYVVPRLDADGTEAVFATLQAPRRGNLTPSDDDNDGRLDEDPPEDLNGDGVITMMRAQDPRGPFAPARDDARLMKRADAQKGEAGGWSVYWEGVDSDRDGFLNEDGVGGVELDRNFPHQYPAYTPGAGRHMVSEEESRALLDYVLARRNIAAVVTFGATDTLVGGPLVGGGTSRTPATMDLAAFADEATTAALAVGLVRDAPPAPYQPGGIFDDAFEQPAPRPSPPPSNATRPATSIESTDLDVFRHVGERYREITGIKQLPPTRRAAGAFHEWAYFQFGVPGFSTPGASVSPVVPKPATPADTSTAAAPASSAARSAGEQRRRTGGRRRQMAVPAHAVAAGCLRRVEAFPAPDARASRDRRLAAVRDGAGAGGRRGPRRAARPLPRRAVDVRAACRGGVVDGDEAGRRPLPHPGRGREPRPLADRAAARDRGARGQADAGGDRRRAGVDRVGCAEAPVLSDDRRLGPAGADRVDRAGRAWTGGDRPGGGAEGRHGDADREVRVMTRVAGTIALVAICATFARVDGLAQSQAPARPFPTSDAPFKTRIEVNRWHGHAELKSPTCSGSRRRGRSS